MATESHDFEWFLKNQEAYDQLTNEQILALGRGEEIVIGDTPAETPPAEDSSATPDAGEDDTTATETPPVEPIEVAGVLTKDGKHIIPFSELETARDQAAQLKELSDNQAKIIAEFQAAKKADEVVGTTDAVDAAMAKLNEEYPDLALVMTPAIEAVINARVNATVAQLEKKFTEALAPIQQNIHDASSEAHFALIVDAVPDFDALVASGDVVKWIDEKLPSYARSGAHAVLKEGTASEVIKLFSDYKEAAGITTKEPVVTETPADSKETLAAKAAAVIAKAKKVTPKSASEIPSAAPIVGEIDETTLNAAQLLARYEGKSPAAILKDLARVI